MQSNDIPYEDYYSGKFGEYHEKDDSIRRAVFNFGEGKKCDQKYDTQKMVMAFYIQNQSILSSMRHLMDKIEVLEEKIAKLEEKKDV